MAHITLEQLTKWRQDLHQIPELGLAEYKTAAYIREQLTAMGITFEPIIETGTIVFFAAGSEETIAFRADIDALPIAEESGVSFCSKHEGNMHACGHDGHTATLLGFAKYLSENKEKLTKNILLIFQPAEEGPGGAALIMETGLFAKYNVSECFALHLFPEIAEGVIAAKSGPIMAQGCAIEVTIKGKSAHGAMPQDGVDAIVVASDLVNTYQKIISRMMDPINPYVLTFGTIQGGDAQNIIAEEVILGGTIRTFSNADMQMILQKIADINTGLGIMYGCEIELVQPEIGYPAVINDNKTYDIFKKALQNNSALTYQELERPYMTSEDFSAYQGGAPGVFFFVGSRNDEKGYVHALHNNKFNFDEKILLAGVEAFITIAKAFSQ
jgi:amidohydrolase